MTQLLGGARFCAFAVLSLCRLIVRSVLRPSSGQAPHCLRS
jgi:hypothetical protein